jgi:nucleoside-diphosphate-sugar epimerase
MELSPTLSISIRIMQNLKIASSIQKPSLSASHQNEIPENRTSYPAKISRIITAAKATVKNIIFISSTSVYGDHNKKVTETAATKPDTASGKAMLRAEQLLQQETSFKTTVIRFAGLIGPDRYPGRFFAGKTDIPNGLAPINLIHLTDCIALTIKILEQQAFGITINACTPDHPAKQDFYTLAAKNINLSAPGFISELISWKIVSTCHTPQTLNYQYKISNWADWLKADK